MDVRGRRRHRVGAIYGNLGWVHLNNRIRKKAKILRQGNMSRTWVLGEEGKEQKLKS